MQGYEQIQDQIIFSAPSEEYYDLSTSCVPSVYIVSLKRQTVRVILGELGQLVRMSAPAIDIVVEGASIDETWAKFLEEIGKQDYRNWMSFDVGPTRREEIEEGLNVPEDEDWSEPADCPKG
jgi:hypothetical protein